MKSLARVVFAVLLQIISCKAQSFELKDTNQVIRLNLEAWEVRVSDPDLSWNYASKALHIAAALHYTKGLSYSYNIFGNYFRINGHYDSATFYYMQSLKIRQSLHDTLGIVRSYRNLMVVQKELDSTSMVIKTGLLALSLLNSTQNRPAASNERAWLEVALADAYRIRNDLAKAIQLLSDAKDIFTRQHDETGQAAARTNLGIVYDLQKRYAEALTEYTTAVPLLLQTDNQEELAKVYNNMGDIYYFKYEYGHALSYYSRSLGIRRAHGFKEDIKGSLLNLGIIYETLGKPDSAVYYYKQALDYSIRSGDREVQYEAHRALGTFFYNRENYPGALHHLIGAQRLSAYVAISAENNILLKELSRAYSAVGNKDSALFYSDQYTLVSDSLNEMMRKSIEIGANFREIEKDKKLTEEKLRGQTITIIGMWMLMSFLLIIFFLYYLFVRSKRKAQKLQELVKDNELKTMDAMLEGQQEERKRLATELHDTIGSMLSATKYSFKAMEKSMEKMVEENRGQYQKINSMLDETMDSVRRISHDMAAGIFNDKGIEGALVELCERFEQPGKLQISLNVHGVDEKLNSDIEKNVYLTVQELLANIVRHAHASEVTIQLIKSIENINLTVEDDGRGFDPLEVGKKKGMGLSNIDLRVKKLAGRWNIDSGKGRGTTVIIDIPVAKNS